MLHCLILLLVALSVKDRKPVCLQGRGLVMLKCKISKIRGQSLTYFGIRLRVHGKVLLVCVESVLAYRICASIVLDHILFLRWYKLRSHDVLH